MASRYIHTIEGRVGYFVPNAFAPAYGQICYVNNGVKVEQLIVPDYRTMRRQRAESTRSRVRYCAGVAPKYGYLRVKV
jgi:hypothetical protein